MQRILWRLAAASGVAVSLAFGAGPVAASRSEAPHRPEPTVVQFADQAARTEQDAKSSAQSEQFLPTNANVPVQILSLGHNGGDTKQSNDSTATSNAENEAESQQSADQNQDVEWKPGPNGHDDRKGHGDRKGHDDRKGHGPKGCDDHQGYGPEGHDGGYRPEPPRAVQVADQHASTDQDATSRATSKQVLPINVNVPVQVLSLGHNGGDTKQSNDSTATSNAENEAWTQQSASQDQHTGSGGAFQGAAQSASTEQDATSSATSEQIAPVNVNAPIQVLSLGANGGDTHQSNSSTAQSSATNDAGTAQVLDQSQSVLGGLIG